MLRDVRDATVSSLSSRINDVVTGLRTLAARLAEIKEYLQAVVAGKLPLNHEILAGMQDILTLLPNLEAGGLGKGLSVQLNDSLLVVYVASLVRSILALHNLIENKEERIAALTDEVSL